MDLPLPSTVQQIDALQAMRALAVILVAWFHAGLYLCPPGGRRLPDLGDFGVDIFFVISGFILSSVILRAAHPPGLRGAWSFLKRRLIRIFPIYWIFAGLALIRLLHTGQHVGPEFLPSIFLLPPWVYPNWPLVLAPAWTLVFEMFFYCVLALTQCVTVRRAVPIAIGLLSLSVAIGATKSIHQPILIVVGNPILLEFVFGACLAILYRKIHVPKTFGFALAVGSCVAASVVQHKGIGGAHGVQLVLTGQHVFSRVITWGIIALLLVAGTVFCNPSFSSFIGRMILFLGNASYSAYLATSLVIEFLGRLLLTHGATSGLISRACLQLLLTSSVLIAGCLVYQFVEWPLLRKLQAKLL